MSSEVIDAPAPDSPAAATPPPAKRQSIMRELPFLAVVAVVLALVIKAVFVQAFFIPSGSMEKTLHGCPGCKGDRVLVNKVLYDVRSVHRGEIVVFDGKRTDFPPEATPSKPSNGLAAAARGLQRLLGLGAPGERDYIKRVIGLPGDQVICCKNGKVVVNGRALDEPYVFEDDHMAFCAGESDDTAPATADQCGPTATPFVVPKGRLFVLGDHRGASADSRYHGTIPISSVIGRAFVRVWPLTRWGVLRVPATFSKPSQTSAAATSEPAKPLVRSEDPARQVNAGGDPALVAGALGALPLTVARRRLRTRRNRMSVGRVEL